MTGTGMSLLTEKTIKASVRYRIERGKGVAGSSEDSPVPEYAFLALMDDADRVNEWEESTIQDRAHALYLIARQAHACFTEIHPRFRHTHVCEKGSGPGSDRVEHDLYTPALALLETARNEADEQLISKAHQYAETYPIRAAMGIFAILAVCTIPPGS